MDPYTVRMVEPFSQLHEKALLLLYQPLIGSMAVNLYLTLYYRLERDAYMCDESTHRELMITTAEELPTILDARKRLEAIGLLKTYMQKQNDERVFLYELSTPMLANEFFADPFLGVFLQNRIGVTKFRQIRQRFSTPKIDKHQWEEKTVAFNDVFTSLKDRELNREDREDSEELVGDRDRSSLVVNDRQFDFELVKTFLPAFFDHEAMLTDSVKKDVRSLSFVYQLDEMEMSRLMIEAMIGDDTIDIERLRTVVKNWYRHQHGQNPPKLGLRTTADEEVPSSEKPEQMSEDEKMASYYNRISPYELLESISEATVSPPDIKLAESLVHDYKLPVGVVNTLIDYVMRTHDQRLDAPLVQKIAGDWSRKKIKTVEEAMNHAKQEYQKRKQVKDKPSKSTNRPSQTKNKKSQQNQDKLPKWLTGERQEEPSEEKRKKAEEERKKFELLLQKYKKGDS